MESTPGNATNKPVGANGGAQKATSGHSAGAAHPQSKGIHRLKIAVETLTVSTAVLCIIGGVSLFANNLLKRADPKPEIIASPRQISNEWHIAGSILLPGKALTNATVRAVAADDRGNGSPVLLSTNSLPGEFKITGLPVLPANTNYHEVIIRAEVIDGGASLEAQTALLLTKDRVRAVRRADLSQGFIPLVLVFFGSVLLGLMTPRCSDLFASLGYYGSVISAVFLTVMMVGYIGGITKMNEICRPGEVLSVGFANIMEGSYLKDGPTAWLLSFTDTPREIAIAQGTLRGFGAPLWVIFLGALGSGLFTILILIRGIREKLDLKREEAIAARIEDVVLHQFFILFSPIGAIFCYQSMVMTGIAGHEVSIALLALAAGVSLNILLDRAVEMMKRVLPGKPPTGAATPTTPGAEKPAPGQSEAASEERHYYITNGSLAVQVAARDLPPEIKKLFDRDRKEFTKDNAPGGVTSAMAETATAGRART